MFCGKFCLTCQSLPGSKKVCMIFEKFIRPACIKCNLAIYQRSARLIEKPLPDWQNSKRRLIPPYILFRIPLTFTFSCCCQQFWMILSFYMGTALSYLSYVISWTVCTFGRTPNGLYFVLKFIFPHFPLRKWYFSPLQRYTDFTPHAPLLLSCLFPHIVPFLPFLYDFIFPLSSIFVTFSTIVFYSFFQFLS